MKKLGIFCKIFQCGKDKTFVFLKFFLLVVVYASVIDKLINFYETNSYLVYIKDCDSYDMCYYNILALPQ